jgi:hypothetical protein
MRFERKKFSKKECIFSFNDTITFNLMLKNQKKGNSPKI